MINPQWGLIQWIIYQIIIRIHFAVTLFQQNTGCSDSLIQLWLSQYIMVESGTWSNNPEISFLNHNASVHASHVAIYFSYVVLSATDLCFLLAHDIIAEPKLKHIPEVLFLSSTLPAQSEWVNPCSCTSLFEAYLKP
jgi:hypothetical protein